VPTWSAKDGLLSDAVQTLLREPDGTLCVGTAGGGLSRWKQGRIANVTTRQGLAQDSVLQLVADDLGHFWLGGNRGISRVKRQELNDLADGRNSCVYPLVFGRSDGMASERCTGGFGPLGLKLQSVRLLFATVRGIVEVDPRRSSPLAEPPRVWLEEALVDGEPLRRPLNGSKFLLKRRQRASGLKREKTGLASLTPTERRVLLFVSENKTNKAIAAELFISPRTVETHRANLCKKLQLLGAHKRPNSRTGSKPALRATSFSGRARSNDRSQP
jgi:DNA-binding CsgD family transcriptional regulator